MKITTYDFNKLSEKQHEALVRAVLGDNDHQIHPGTANSLVKRGLIQPYDAIVRGLRVTRYKMPIPVHIEWCEWCDTNSDGAAE